ncbi:membrane-spanning 4-domains subfamily A member 4A-like isoform X1 [Colossoma macropomum]|uniref:membrane-spanning 4-domains subfamily A member 4A-like isoform X1 n=1 Tax=Colossoma macropomum TaxID=42526 RepID=UPI001864F7B4|nr:membrane-spanning 4-domains subfamily A member 4A-like isoform X1 [Colossoma macropomum]XP_036427252.1 membrane-spanning 4-domains subfamily A member 4A-like isoform X1 [Colossoma macropomum]
MSHATIMGNYPQNDFMVVTHGIPLATTGQNGAEARPGVLTFEAPSWRYQRANPMGVGVLQILFGFIHFVCGIVMTASITDVSFYTGIYLWGALTYIITGYLNVAAHNSSNRLLIYISVGMNILSFVTAGIIVILLAVDMAEGLGFSPCNFFWISSQCRDFRKWGEPIRGVLMGMSTFLLVISIFMSVLGCKATCFTEPTVIAVRVVPSQTACSTMVTPFQTHSGQQDVFYITNTNTTLNNPPTEDPPAYSTCVA